MGVARKFWQASMCPLQVGLSDLAKSDGETPNFPYKLSFKSDLDVSCPCGTPDEYISTCLANLMSKVQTDGKIFDVFATPAPGSEGDKTKIGEIILTSELRTSIFGDEKLFFRHQHMEEDFKLKEEWLNAIDKKSECGMNGVTTEKPTLTSGCAHLFDPTRSDDGMLNTDLNTTNETVSSCVKAGHIFTSIALLILAPVLRKGLLFGEASISPAILPRFDRGAFLARCSNLFSIPICPECLGPLRLDRQCNFRQWKE